jgi:hypothetical protein
VYVCGLFVVVFKHYGAAAFFSETTFSLLSARLRRHPRWICGGRFKDGSTAVVLDDTVKRSLPRESEMLYGVFSLSLSVSQTL